MEYAKDEVFLVRYNTNFNRLEIEEDSWGKRFYKKIKSHKFLMTTIIAFFMFSTIHMIMLYSFMKILQNI